MKRQYISLFRLREECKPILEREEQERKERINKFLHSIGIARNK